MQDIDGMTLARITNGRIISGDPKTLVSSISTDTRTITKGEIFVPLAGETFDGHAFISEAETRGAAGWFTTYGGFIALTSALVIEVADTLKALHAVARYVRVKSAAKVIAITGSSGKTTTRSMCERIIDRNFNTISSPKNFNNEIGLPLTLLKASLDTEVIIVEMGMRALGDITLLCETALPDVGCVTNVGSTHYALLKSEENIGKAKGELVEAISKSGTAILNEDDEWTQRYRDIAQARIITYGLKPEADIRADKVESRNGRPVFTLDIFGEKGFIELPLLGRHNIYNALAAAAISNAVGVSFEDIVNGLHDARNESMRLQVETTADGIIVINDAYNANPDSTRAALETLAEAAQGNKIAVLGDMLELGDISFAEHSKIGRIAAELDVGLLVTVGKEAAIIGEAAAKAGLPRCRIHHASDVDSAVNFLRNRLRPQDTVLVKASRGMGFERIVDGIVG